MASRTIHMSIERPFNILPPAYDVVIPHEVQMASKRRELLDENPLVGGPMQYPRDIHVVARSSMNRTMYPDYSLFFIPLRHLVFQGSVVDPTRPGSNLSYSSLRDVQRRLDDVVGLLMSKVHASTWALAVYFDCGVDAENGAL
eukprot:m.210932 g.210932  ORF g.210932 m.210932 type:complete len:143 (+) comp19022_c0_seq12:411-839(+)